MRVRASALLAAVLALSLCGCSSMLERDYVTSTRHVEYHVDEDASVLQAESYQGLVSALFYFVTGHADTGVVHLSNYVGDVGEDLAAACAEVLEEDPIGAYALEDIEHTHTRIVSYYEVFFTFTYAHTEEEMEAIRPVPSTAALHQAVAAAMTAFDSRCVVSMNFFAGDEVSLLSDVRQLWLDTPLAALAYPEVRVRLYPDSGASRVIELTFQWPEEADDLAGRRSALEASALRLLSDLTPPPGGMTAEFLLTSLLQRAVLDREAGGSTAYDAIVDGTANGQGMALALKLLCQLSDVEATVVEGRLAGEGAYWLIITTPDGSCHLDPSSAHGPCSDEALSALGYEWSAERYPACAGPAPAVREPEPPGDAE